MAKSLWGGVIENEKEKIILRELKSILCSTVLNIKIKLLEKGNKWFEDACVQGISKQEQEKLYKKAAFLGNKKAHRKLFPDLEDISSTPTNASPKSPENSSNTSTNNSTQGPSASSDTSSTHSGHSSNTSSHNSTQGNSTNKHNNFSEDKKIENLEHSLCLFSIGNDRNVRVAILNDEKNWNFVSIIGKDWQAHTLSNRYQPLHLFSDGSLPDHLFSSISVTSFNETYRMIAVGKQKEWCEYNKIWGVFSTDGKNWMDVKEISPALEAGGGVSLCSFKKDLYLVHTGKNHGIWLSVSRDGKFANAFRINDLDWCAYDAISLTAFKEKLYLAYINKTGQICIISSPDGKEWTKPREILNSSNDIYHTADLSIGFTSFKDKLYLGYTGREYDCGKIIREQHVNRYKHNFLKMNKSSKMNSKDFLLGSKKGIWLTSSEDGEIWGESMSIMEQKTADCVNLTVFQENLCFAFQSEKRIWLSYSKDGQNWADPQDSNWDSDGQFCLTPLLKVSHK